MAAKLNIHGTDFLNTEEGVAAFATSIREMAVAHERGRRAANDRRDRGDYGIELSAAIAALTEIDNLAYPEDDIRKTRVALRDAQRVGFSGHDAFVPDQLDAVVDALNLYAGGMVNELAKLAELAYVIRHGRESTE